VTIESEITSRIKRALADHIFKKYKEELMEKQAQRDIFTTIDHIVIPSPKTNSVQKIVLLHT
jgi:hypothetical protein